jgi:UDP-N-acetylmuramyl pentapeptide phosphotransferase/UDP-N-acetylglucosamine-1-phosphate transferase
MLLFLAAALISAGLIALLHPLLVRYALARPNARSSHRTPTPQGAGIAVIAATTAVVVGAVLLAHDVAGTTLQLAVVLACAAGLAVVGVADDSRTPSSCSTSAIIWETADCVTRRLSAAFAMLPQSATTNTTWRSRSRSLRPIFRSQS